MTKDETNAKPEANGYSIWLTPASPQHESLQHCIVNLSRALGGPIFQPHITLIGQLMEEESSIIPKFRTLAGEVNIVSLKVENLGGEDAYFRALYFEIFKSPELQSLNQRARRIFQRHHDAPFFPHLSLLYGHHPLSVKQKAFSRSGCTPPRYLDFGTLDLIRTVGPVHEWSRIESLPIK